MVRTALIVLAGSLVLAPAASAAGPTTSVSLTSCERGHRAAEFEAAMDDVPGAERLAMRFTLQSRERGHRRYRRVEAPGFSEWTSSSPGVERYVFTRRVEGLVGPARYRVVVRFKWLDADEQVIARARRRSRACRQRDHRPNLKVLELSHEGGDTYLARVANRGPTASGRFELELAVDGELLAPVEVDDLQPRAERLIELRGPECVRSARAVADPLDLVDERVERDNAFILTCR